MTFEASLVARLKAADALYLSRDWAAALPALQQILDTAPDWAAIQSVPLMRAHCSVELASAHDVETLVPTRGSGASKSAREEQLIGVVRERVNLLCRSGEYGRASALLRVLSDYDAPIARSLMDSAMRDRDGRVDEGRTRFSDDPTLDAKAVADAKRRFGQLRMLTISPKFFPDNPDRACEPYDCILRTARRYGLAAAGLNAAFLPPGVELANYASWLQAQIIAFRPDVILYADLFETGISASDALVTEQIATVLENVRTRLGVRVVNSLLDAWAVVQNGIDRPLRRLGTCVDLFHHMHPTLTQGQTTEERAASFCYPVPIYLPTPSVPGGTIARAGFVGSVLWYNANRLVWRTEIGKRGIPLDFLETDHGAPRRDQDYANLLGQYQVSVNFSSRPSGAKIITGRAIEVGLSEGVLLEEDCYDTAYFLTRGVHYEAFGTLDELAASIDNLLSSEPQRRNLARENHRWVTEYFTGDRFWSGLFARLYT